MTLEIFLQGLEVLEWEKQFNLLLYADDLIVVCRSSKDIQTWIDRLERYTETWNLSVNVDKIKSIGFH